MTRLLVADDDASNLLTLSALLEDEGFVVDEASSFAEASEKLARSPGPYALVVSDQHLGDGLGTSLVEVVRYHMPKTKVVICSGSAGEESLESAADASVNKAEPFSTLLTTIRRLVAQ